MTKQSKYRIDNKTKVWSTLSGILFCYYTITFTWCLIHACEWVSEWMQGYFVMRDGVVTKSQKSTKNIFCLDIFRMLVGMCKIRLESSSFHCPGQFTLNCFLGSAGWKWKRTVELTTCFLRMERGEMKAWEKSLSFNSFVKMMIWINPVITAALHYTINIINHISTTSSNLWRGTVQEECRHQLLDQETIYVCCFLVINWSVFIDFTHF